MIHDGYERGKSQRLRDLEARDAQYGEQLAPKAIAAGPPGADHDESTPERLPPPPTNPADVVTGALMLCAFVGVAGFFVWLIFIPPSAETIARRENNARELRDWTAKKEATEARQLYIDREADRARMIRALQGL